ncbi:hypothetical protein VOLCADRAFT_103410 [Volvox carteri f. nagariensis]|uniref:Uncharacterized protein n=1 Tax=Volvox carteri f. nagariensis TaxID=3068 RepID=D8TLP3_VOLCA|nr:uncharacterized protein VOLCADRAFT_103410 [Volvox carteri f. nagariensis]EFJ51502.1 hypothetical protein VOLCADRAFT_103410 [Volvox carteri f. nagariensis]|eukprot:XP_002947454.1 hypothetical protein VOLCADRAFT_103410 [Volvox carteri f. nagariensis]
MEVHYEHPGGGPQPPPTGTANPYPPPAAAHLGAPEPQGASGELQQISDSGLAALPCVPSPHARPKPFSAQHAPGYDPGQQQGLQSSHQPGPNVRSGFDHSEPATGYGPGPGLPGRPAARPTDTVAATAYGACSLPPLSSTPLIQQPSVLGMQQLVEGGGLRQVNQQLLPIGPEAQHVQQQQQQQSAHQGVLIQNPALTGHPEVQGRVGYGSNYPSGSEVPLHGLSTNYVPHRPSLCSAPAIYSGGCNPMVGEKRPRSPAADDDDDQGTGNRAARRSRDGARSCEDGEAAKQVALAAALRCSDGDGTGRVPTVLTPAIEPNDDVAMDEGAAMAEAASPPPAPPALQAAAALAASVIGGPACPGVGAVQAANRAATLVDTNVLVKGLDHPLAPLTFWEHALQRGLRPDAGAVAPGWQPPRSVGGCRAPAPATALSPTRLVPGTSVTALSGGLSESLQAIMGVSSARALASAQAQAQAQALVPPPSEAQAQAQALVQAPFEAQAQAQAQTPVRVRVEVPAQDSSWASAHAQVQTQPRSLPQTQVQGLDFSQGPDRAAAQAQAPETTKATVQDMAPAATTVAVPPEAASGEFAAVALASAALKAPSQLSLRGLVFNGSRSSGWRAPPPHLVNGPGSATVANLAPSQYRIPMALRQATAAFTAGRGGRGGRGGGEEATGGGGNSHQSGSTNAEGVLGADAAAASCSSDGGSGAAAAAAVLSVYREAQELLLQQQDQQEPQQQQQEPQDCGDKSVNGDISMTEGLTSTYYSLRIYM